MAELASRRGTADEAPHGEDNDDIHPASAMRDQLLASDVLQGVVAFHKWRYSSLRANYRKKVAEALEGVDEEERRHHELERSHEELVQR